MSRSNWAERFLQGFKSDDGKPDYRLRRIVEAEPVGAHDEEHELFIAGWNALAHAYTNKALRHLDILIGHAESPIEKAMLFALSVAAHDLATNVRYKANGQLFGDFEEMPDVLTIEPQAQLGEYRVDFLLTYQESLPDFDHKVKLNDGTEIPGIKDVTVHLIVECDGHDFHDRSKKQASRDRERDRELKKLGYEVFRYTGSDIWKNPLACATEAVEVLTKSAWKK
jgi:very-short-patch-repair endonuclease